MPEINFVIDGKAVKADPGETIRMAALRSGIEIPALCSNGKVSHTTSCFVCVVKDKKTGRFLPSCSACPSEGQELESASEEVASMRRTALGLLLSEHTGDCEAPCTLACPAHANVEEYVRAGRQGDFLKALTIIKERIPLPMSIGRVCPRFCERDCRKSIFSKPVSINDFKRLAADLFYDSCMEELPALKKQKVAIVGAGPAGLSAAYYLRRMGYASVIFEKMPKGGGMLRYGIPQFRLPKEILDKELAHFEKMGIHFEYNKALGKDFTAESLAKEYDAVILAIGSWSSSSMRIDGEENANQGIAWLESLANAEWKNCANPGVTIVVGGGNTAMDCARNAIRLGGDVTILYRRTRNEMPAQAIEVEEAMEEGVKFQFLTAPLSLKKQDGRLVLRCQKMILGEPDASGRRSPVPQAGSDFDIAADTVISAIGQRTKAPAEIAVDKRGNVAVSLETLRLDNTMIFAAGDCVSGPATVVEAVAAGHKAADSVADAFEGRVHTEPPAINVSRGHWSSLSEKDIVILRGKECSNEERVKPEYISLEKRRTTFEEISPTIPAEKIMKEGERCIECSCTDKHDCKLRKYSSQYQAQPDMFKGSKLKVAADTRHPYIIQDRMKCIKCGICVKTCSEIINKNLLAFMKRGFSTVVGTAFDQGFPSYCNDCGACIEECPVGALDWKNKK